MSKSIAEQIADLSPEEQEEIWGSYSEEQARDIAFDWKVWGRPEQMPPEDGSWRIFLALAGRGWGKMVAMTTKIPTPTGWVNIGDLKKGDYVFDENGNPTKVTQAFIPDIPKKMFRLTFSDGTTIDAGEEHLWTTWEHRDRKSYNRRNEYVDVDASVGIPEDWPTWSKQNLNGMTDANPIGPKTRSTQEILDTLKYNKRGDLNHSIPVTKPIQYPERSLPLDPYLYGYYLGDGSMGTGGLTVHNDEIDWLRGELSLRGYSTTVHKQEPGKNCRTVYVLDIVSILKTMGSMRKEVNQDYLVASEQQRRDFLAGLLDSDGFISLDSGFIEFCAKRIEHAEAVVQLARSLGQKPVMGVGRATLNGVDYGPKYRVKWRPTENFFYMPRKAVRFKPLAGQASRSMHRMITKIEEIPPVLSRCIAVDSPNHLFLAGEGMIPTHNSRAGAEWVRSKVEQADEAGKPIEILLLGRTSADVRDVMVKAILECSPPGNMPVYLPSKRRLEWPGGSYALCTSSEKPDQLRGPSAHYGWADELAALKATVDDAGTTAWANLLFAVREGKNPQIFGTTTPKRTKLMKDLVKDSSDPTRRIQIVKGSTFDNTSLGAAYIEDIVSQYEGSDLAKQELYGEMLLDAEGIFFTEKMIEDATIDPREVPKLALRFIAVDPSVAERPSDECGIVAVGVTGESNIRNRTAYILEDYSMKGAATEWVPRVVAAAKAHNTKYVVVEGNQGRQLLEMVIAAEDPSLKVFLVNAKQGKHKRAEPVIVAMQQHRVKLVDLMPDLTDQMLFFDPENIKSSPDRMDAMVWGVIAALVDPPKGLRIYKSRLTSPADLKLPQNRGTARTSSKAPIRRSGGFGGSRSSRFG